MKNGQGTDSRARKAMADDAITFSLDPVFPTDGKIESKLVMRLPIAMQIACYSFDTEFMLGAFMLGKAVDIWSAMPRDAVGMAPKIYIPISMRVLSDYRFVELVAKTPRLLENASWFILMGTPDSLNYFPEQLDIHGLAIAYKKIGIQISVGEIQAQHINVSIVQDGIESVLPAAKLERTPNVASSLTELKSMAAKIGVPCLSNCKTPWVMSLAESKPRFTAVLNS